VVAVVTRSTYRINNKPSKHFGTEKENTMKLTRGLCAIFAFALLLSSFPANSATIQYLNGDQNTGQVTGILELDMLNRGVFDVTFISGFYTDLGPYEFFGDSLGGFNTNASMVNLLNSDGMATSITWSSSYYFPVSAGGGNVIYRRGNYDGANWSQSATALPEGFGPITIAKFTQVVPEPAAAWLFGSSLLGLIGISRHKKTA